MVVPRAPWHTVILEPISPVVAPSNRLMPVLLVMPANGLHLSTDSNAAEPTLVRWKGPVDWLGYLIDLASPVRNLGLQMFRHIERILINLQMGNLTDFCLTLPENGDLRST